jgi:hypothetical protein
MTLAPKEFRVLTGIEVEGDDRTPAGTIVLTWSTSRKIDRAVQLMDGEYQNVEMVEPATVKERIPFADGEEMKRLLGRYEALIHGR